jgi:uncharacterized membrane protein YhhN
MDLKEINNNSMNRTLWLVLFFVITAADIFAIATDNDDLRWLTKPFIILLLIGYLVSSLTLVKSKVHKWVIAALVFSWGGDVLLMLEPQNSSFFIYGLVSFLIAHICYIDFFQVVKRKEKIKTNWLFVFLVLIYYVGLIVLLFSHLGELKVPVIIYGAVISTMLALALHMPAMKYKTAGMNMIIGAALFIVSDSVLAINKFYKPFEGAGVVIMFTYAFAQLLIVAGVIKYIRVSTVN